MKTLREMMDLIESAQAPVAEGYTPTAGELAQDHIKMADGDFNKKYGMSKQQAKQHYSSNKLKDQDVAEDQATAKMGLMSAMGSNDNNPADQRRVMAQQAVEQLAAKR
jgi:hypothetical protein